MGHGKRRLRVPSPAPGIPAGSIGDGLIVFQYPAFALDQLISGHGGAWPLAKFMVQVLENRVRDDPTYEHALCFGDMGSLYHGSLPEATLTIWQSRHGEPFVHQVQQHHVPGQKASFASRILPQAAWYVDNRGGHRGLQFSGGLLIGTGPHRLFTLVSFNRPSSHAKSQANSNGNVVIFWGQPQLLGVLFIIARAIAETGLGMHSIVLAIIFDFLLSLP